MAKGIVLIALDGSPESTTALPVARAVASQLGAKLAALHVAAQPLPEPELRRSLGLGKASLRGIDIRIKPGDAAESILREAETGAVELLVMTTHGGDTNEGKLGRVAKRVIAATTQPVLLVRPEAAGERTVSAPALGRLLAPLDGTREAAESLRPAADLAARLGASVDVLYVAPAQSPSPPGLGSMTGPRYVDQPQHEWPQWAQELKERFCVHCAGFPPTMKVGVYLKRGEPGREIVEFAAERHYDAILVVRKSHLETGRAGILRTVLREAPCPVLLIGSTPEPEG